MDDLARQFPEGTIAQSIYVSSLQAQMAFLRGDLEKTIDALKTTTSYELGQNDVPLQPVYLRGQAYLATRVTKRKLNF